MAEIAVLEEKVVKAEAKVAKCKKTIERHEKQLEKKVQAGAEGYEIKFKENDVKGATQKLQEAEQILENWKAKLSVEIEKERFLEGNAPQVIKDFLEDWKSKAYEWHVQRYEAYQLFKKSLAEKKYEAQVVCVKATPEYARYLGDDGEIDEYYRNDLMNVFPRTQMDKYLKELSLDSRSIRERLNDFAGATVLHMTGIYNKEERLKWLNTRLEKEKKAKMLDLVTRINSVVGTIQDATDLRISPVGNLDGIIQGETGSAKVATIGAGGWNIQCWHYRTLVNKID